MIGSTHPVIALDIARADNAARIRDAEEHAVAAEMRRELRAARADARRARGAAHRAASGRRWLSGRAATPRLGSLLHPAAHTRSHTGGYS